MKYSAIWLLSVLLITGCSLEPPESEEVKAVQTVTIRQEPQGAEELKERAAEIIELVWDVDVSDWEIKTTIDDLEVRFFSEQSNSYFIVGWREGDKIPCWMYRKETEKGSSAAPIDLASAETRARELLTETLGITLGAENAEWYTYADGIAVLLRDKEGIRYHVLYRQSDGALCGYQIFDDEETMHRFYEMHGAEKKEK